MREASFYAWHIPMYVGGLVVAVDKHWTALTVLFAFGLGLSVAFTLAMWRFANPKKGAKT